MIEDSFQTLDPESLDEEAELEVEKILFEVTDGMLGEAGEVGSKFEGAQEEDTNGVDEDPELLARLNSLRIAG